MVWESGKSFFFLNESKSILWASALFNFASLIVLGACASESRKVLGGLLFTCVARDAGFYQQMHVEASLFKKVFPNISMGGFMGLGEIGPEFVAGSDPDNPQRRPASIQG